MLFVKNVLLPHEYHRDLNILVFRDPLPRGWEQTNFVELWSVSRPRLAEMDIEIWVMCQLTEKLFETSSVRWNLQVRIFVQILGDTSTSEHLREWKRKETCIEQKEVWHFEYLAVILESRSWIIVESKIVHPRENSCHSWSQLSSDNGEIGSRSRLYQPEACGPSGPGLGLSTRNNFCFFPFFLSAHPLPLTPILSVFPANLPATPVHLSCAHMCVALFN